MDGWLVLSASHEGPTGPQLAYRVTDFDVVDHTAEGALIGFWT